jgi:hypothetical protein
VLVADLYRSPRSLCLHPQRMSEQSTFQRHHTGQFTYRSRIQRNTAAFTSQLSINSAGSGLQAHQGTRNNLPISTARRLQAKPSLSRNNKYTLIHKCQLTCLITVSSCHARTPSPKKDDRCTKAPSLSLDVTEV